MTKLLATFMFCLFAVSAISPVHAHSGGTDSNGCHKDHKTGGKHCH